MHKTWVIGCGENVSSEMDGDENVEERDEVKWVAGWVGGTGENESSGLVPMMRETRKGRTGVVAGCAVWTEDGEKLRVGTGQRCLGEEHGAMGGCGTTNTFFGVGGFLRFILGGFGAHVCWVQRRERGGGGLLWK